MKLIYYLNLYKKIGFVLLTSLIIFIFLNIFAWVLLQIFKPEPAYLSHFKRYRELLVKTNPNKSQVEIEKLLQETLSRPFSYEPFTGFKEASFSGTFVNVSPKGFRLTKNAIMWPPNPEVVNVFLFGGSTTFGYGVTDDETIAYYIQREMNGKSRSEISVYNFGRGYYYSTQERIMFEQFLTSGIHPDIAIFVDGLNDFIYTEDQPVFTEFMDQNFSGNITNTNYLVKELIYNLPFIQLMKQKFVNPNTSDSKEMDETFYNDEVVLKKITNRYFENKRIIETLAQEYAIKTIFVIQPVNVFEQNDNAKKYTPEVLHNVYYAKYGYPKLLEMINKEKLTDNFLWLADIQRKLTGLLYVDTTHYSPFMNEAIAKEITNFINSKEYMKSSD